MNKKTYCGIGSRKTPQNILMLFQDLAEQLAKMGYTLRSGGADGADLSFEIGCDRANGEKQIFIPWRGFNDSDSSYYDIPDEAFKIAKSFHPHWHYLKQGAQKLHARNSMQILDPELNDPALFVVCYSNPYKGGTSQALRIAKEYNVPIFNFIDKEYNFRNILKRT